MDKTLRHRCETLILGALVADAAAMGLHWIYDQDHIARIAPDAPEFRSPDRADYAGIPGYFAHPTRRAGDQSQYGEQTLVMLHTLSARGTAYTAADFSEAFAAHFGYGGAYVGYIDRATRDTLDNARRAADAAQDCAQALEFDGEARVLKSLVATALPLLARQSGAGLHAAFAEAVAQTHDDPAVQAFVPRLITALDALPRATGAPDLQLPAIAKLPALVAMLVARGGEFESPIAAAIRSTSDHPVAAHYGQISARMMAEALTTGNAEAALRAGAQHATGDARALMARALEQRDTPNTQATQSFGMACDLPMGVPSASHNIATAPDFTQAIRANIHSGGDTCGRAILVGAVMGAVHGIGGPTGIPQDWIDRLGARDRARQAISVLFD